MVDKYTCYMYTNNKKSDESTGLVPLIFQGNSRQALQGFPDGVKSDLGYALYRLQLGQIPPDRKAVQSVGPNSEKAMRGHGTASFTCDAKR
ncbi:MAG TPA: hypothetical protein VHW45_05015 [Candidatus Sulfotelmatobacter sp.]|nr:hypothetical protein [Candidatus Sulfotelmatobacter sp.]